MSRVSVITVVIRVVTLTFTLCPSGPGSWEVRARRVLHGSRGRSPPQCSEQGRFLPVQCQFVNMTDMQVFDLLANFNRWGKHTVVDRKSVV